MDHREITSKLYELYDGELPEDEARSVREHLSGCGECRAEVELWSRARKSFLDQTPVQIPVQFTENVMAKIAAQPRTISWVELIWRGGLLPLQSWKVALAASAFVVASFYILARYLRPNNQADPVLLVYNHVDPWLSGKEMVKEDMLPIVGENSDNSESEAQFYE